MYYKEDKAGQILQEGINEAGGMASWIAAATSYSTNNRIMVPFYVYYSMFGFQRIGDLAWAAGDMQARGFLLGGTSGAPRSTAKACSTKTATATSWPAPSPTASATTRPSRTKWRDPAPRPEAHGGEAGQRLLLPHLLNENYAMPGLTPGTEEQIIKGMYLCKPGAKADAARAAAGLGHHPARVAWPRKNCWPPTGAWPPTCGAAPASTSWPATARTPSAGTCCTRPESRACALRGQQLASHAGPVVASTDYMKAYAEQIRPFIPKGRSYKVLGTDGFGRSDFRSKLREHFEVNRHYIVWPPSRR
jgi:pyruvate dehydrogenase E1 component